MLQFSTKHFLISLFSLSVFLWPQVTFAVNPPILTAPVDNSLSEQAPKLEWEYTGGCFERGSCFRVEVDDSLDFSSPEKTTYTSNFSYSPKGLADGAWNWRVKAKDKTGEWGQWSNAYKFITGEQSQSPYPTASNSPIPTTTPASQKPLTFFTIKDIPKEINSDQEFEVPVSILLPSVPNRIFFIKGAFKKSDSLNYFGYTFSGEWIKNNSSYSAQVKIETDKDGRWDGKIKVKPDSEDSGFDGTGGYVFKVGRYSDTGTGLTWSNEYGLTINAVSNPEPSPPEDPVEEIDEESESEEASSAGLLKAVPSRNYEIKIASVAGEATKSDNTNLEEQTIVLEDRKTNWLLVILGSGIILGGIVFSYFKFKKDRNS